jgi:hypothetical protein
MFFFFKNQIHLVPWFVPKAVLNRASNFSEYLIFMVNMVSPRCCPPHNRKSSFALWPTAGNLIMDHSQESPELKLQNILSPKALTPSVD